MPGDRGWLDLQVSGFILRDAAQTPLLRMRSPYCEDEVSDPHGERVFPAALALSGARLEP